MNSKKPSQSSVPIAKSNTADADENKIDTPVYSTFIYAREPLANRLHELPKSIPVLVLFGDNDWLYNPVDIINKSIQDLQAGKGSTTICAESSSTSVSVSSDANMHLNQGIDITLQVIPNAGHHIYLDNAKDFNDSIARWVNQKGF